MDAYSIFEEKLQWEMGKVRLLSQLFRNSSTPNEIFNYVDGSINAGMAEGLAGILEGAVDAFDEFRKLYEDKGQS